jgi:ATP-dependent exoDNAse (exonuclease V) beta subunit
LTVPTLPTQAEVAVPDCSATVRAAAAADRNLRHAHVRQPSWAATNVTQEAHHQGPTPRIREAVTPEPGVPTSMGAESTSLLHDTSSHRADAGYAWGWLVHGLLEHAMRNRGVVRADLERLARWLTVEFHDLRPYISQAVDVVEGVARAPFWQEAAAVTERQVEVPFAIRVTGDDGRPTVVRGVIDLVYSSKDGRRIVDYKTDRTIDVAKLEQYSAQVAQYGSAWARVASEAAPKGALFFVRAGQLVVEGVFDADGRRIGAP